MRIHNQIRANATFRKWEAFLLDNGTTNSFLPMSTTKFVTDPGAEARYALRGPWPPQSFLKLL